MGLDEALENSVTVVRGMRRPVQLEGLEQSLGHSGQRGPQRGECVSGRRATSGSVRESHCVLSSRWRISRWAETAT